MTTADADNQQGNQDTKDNPGQPPAPAYTPQIFNGTLPAAHAAIAKSIQAVEENVQRQHAKKLYKFLSTPESNMLELNLDTNPRTAFINLPKSQKVKLLFCRGVEASGIGRTSVVNNKFLWLCGNGGQDIGAPSPVTFPTTAQEMQTVACMSEEIFEQRLRDKGGEVYAWPLAARRTVTTTANIMQITPIPAFLVYNGIDEDLDAAVVQNFGIAIQR